MTQKHYGNTVCICAFNKTTKQHENIQIPSEIPT